MKMLRKLMTFVAVIAFVESKSTHVQYPQTNPCILLDIELNNTLTRNGNESTPTYSFEDTNVITGKCEGVNKHTIILKWSIDNATIQMDFVNDTGSVSMFLTFVFVPFKVWGSGSKETVTLSSSVDVGHTDKSFMCGTSLSVHFNATKDATNALYEADWNILNIHAQAFGVKNGEFSKDENVTMQNITAVGHTSSSYMCNTPFTVTLRTEQGGIFYESQWKFINIHLQAFSVDNETYSEAEHCAGDQTTTEPTTHATNGTTEHTTHATNGTTEHTTHATNGTTEHTKPTTENGTTEHPTTVTTHPTTENGTTEPTNSSTEAPTTMTTAPVTTKIPPANHPKNTYTFNNTGTKWGHCVRMTAQILFKINYPGGAKPAEIDIPDESKYPVKVSGDCNYTGMGLNMMKIEFRNTWSIQIVFSNSKVKSEMLGVDDDNSFWWKDVTLNYTYDAELFPGVWKNLTGKTETVYTNFSSHQYAADTDGSYICNSDTTLELSKDVKMETWDLQYFAFENRTDFNKDKVSQCTADSKTNSVVPIAVGAALAGLVVIVLIAYLIGRRRNRKGYESV